MYIRAIAQIYQLVLHNESISLRTLKYQRASAPHSVAGFDNDANFHMTLTSAATAQLQLLSI